MVADGRMPQITTVSVGQFRAWSTSHHRSGQKSLHLDGRSFERGRVEARQLKICISVDSAWSIEPVMSGNRILGHAAH
jgi:hypothetical protein